MEGIPVRIGRLIRTTKNSFIQDFGRVLLNTHRVETLVVIIIEYHLVAHWIGQRIPIPRHHAHILYLNSFFISHIQTVLIENWLIRHIIITFIQNLPVVLLHVILHLVVLELLVIAYRVRQRILKLKRLLE